MNDHIAAHVPLLQHAPRRAAARRGKGDVDTTRHAIGWAGHAERAEQAMGWMFGLQPSPSEPPGVTRSSVEKASDG